MGNCCGKNEPWETKISRKRSVKAAITSDNDNVTLLLFVALFDYDARTSKDLTFKKGDYFEVKLEYTAFNWWLAKSRSSQQEGYIPSNYVAKVNSAEAKE